MSERIKVVGALIWNKKNEFLICQRPKNKARGLLWEFVGGKVEDNESSQEALIRECKEELNIDVKPIKVFSETLFNYPDMKINLIIYLTKIIKGTPKLLEHNNLKWIKPESINNYEFCPADIPIIEKIKRDYLK